MKESPYNEPFGLTANSYALGDWRVTIQKNNSEKAMHGLAKDVFCTVRMLYKRTIVMSSHGLIAFQNACDMVQHFHARGYVPHIPENGCLADHNAAARARLCIKGDDSKPQR